jgi:hypothetical protein
MAASLARRGVPRLIGSIDDDSGTDWQVHGRNLACRAESASGMQETGRRLTRAVSAIARKWPRHSLGVPNRAANSGNG